MDTQESKSMYCRLFTQVLLTLRIEHPQKALWMLVFLLMFGKTPSSALSPIRHTEHTKDRARVLSARLHNGPFAECRMHVLPFSCSQCLMNSNVLHPISDCGCFKLLHC